MQNPTRSRRAEVFGDTLRRLLRKGASTRIHNLLGKVRSEDVAVSLRGLTDAEQMEVFRILGAHMPESAHEVLTELDPSQRIRLLERMEDELIVQVFSEMPVDDVVSVVDDLSDELKEKVLSAVRLEQGEQVQAQFVYDEDTAGRIMDTEFFSLDQDVTVKRAIREIRSNAEVDMIFYVYVVNEVGHLMGVASLRQLILASPDQTLKEMMIADLIKVNVNTDQEEVAQLAARYDLLAIPVLDEDNRMAGIVTVDDVVDILKEEATEDIYKMVGTSDDELLYQDRPFRVSRIRLPWILFALVSSIGSGTILSFYSGVFTPENYTILLVFGPLIAAMGGNIGTQSSTLTVRGLATGRLWSGQGRIREYLWFQFKVGLLMAVFCASLAGAYAFYKGQMLWLPLAVGFALIVVMVFASLNGVLFPLMFRRLNIDPAVASGPLVTVTMDITGFFIYFSVAGLTLQYFAG